MLKHVGEKIFTGAMNSPPDDCRLKFEMFMHWYRNEHEPAKCITALAQISSFLPTMVEYMILKNEPEGVSVRRNKPSQFLLGFSVLSLSCIEFDDISEQQICENVVALVVENIIPFVKVRFWKVQLVM